MGRVGDFFSYLPRSVLEWVCSVLLRSSALSVVSVLFSAICLYSGFENISMWRVELNVVTMFFLFEIVLLCISITKFVFFEQWGNDIFSFYSFLFGFDTRKTWKWCCKAEWIGNWEIWQTILDTGPDFLFLETLMVSMEVLHCRES